MENSEKKEEPKRTRRHRTPVTLLQNEYDTIYSYSNNHKQGKAKSKTNLSNENDGDANSTDVCSSPSSKVKTASSSLSATTTNFQWVGKGHSKKGVNDRLHYRRLEIIVGGHPAVIQVGDDILVSSHELEEDELLDKTPTILKRSIGDTGGAVTTDSIGTKPENVAMNGLKPFIGKVEDFFEIVTKKHAKGSSHDVVKYSDKRKEKMRLRIKWYYKKEDIASLKGQFDGISRQEILSSLSPRDLLLGEIADENEISTILGKCSVVRCKPAAPSKEADNMKSSISKRSAGSFRCSYNISVQNSGAKQHKITIYPHDGPEFEDVSVPPTKRQRSEANFQDSDNETLDSQATESVQAEPLSMDDNLSAPEDCDDDSYINESTSKMPPTTEGSATQQIMVGEKHQAVISKLVTNKGFTSKRGISPTLVWKPNVLSGEEFDSFVVEIGKILKEYLKQSSIEITRSLPHNLSPKHLPSNFTCREFDMDAICKVLHDKSYNVSVAIKNVKDNPKRYLFLWTKEDKELYNTGFRRHFSTIRLISKGMGEAKNHKEVVDYHYRFKIPDQFKRYEDKKREQARRILECVDRHRLEEYLSQGSSQIASTNSGNVTKKSQSWSKTGGGSSSAVGEAESRRIGAKEFLVAMKDTIGIENYLILVNHLKGLHSRVMTIPQCREGFASVLEQNHPELMKRFDEYLPRKFRNK